MASIQELLMAAEAQKSPFISMMEGAAQGFGQAQAQGPSRIKELIALQQEQEDRARAKEMHNQLMAQISGAQENKVQGLLKTAQPPQASAHPGIRLAGATSGADGLLKPRFDVVEPKETAYQAKDYRDAQGRARIGKFNPKTGQLVQDANDPFAPQTARGETAGNLRKEFIDRPEVKEYVTIGTQVKSMDALLNSALAGNQQNKVSLDQALITMYNKLTDPNSVVRESEYARTGENLPLVNRISGAIGKVQSGGAGLTDDDRKALVLGAKIIANERGAVFNQRRAEYNTLAQKMDLEPSVITGTLPEFKPHKLNPVSEPAAAQAFTVGKYKVIVR